MAAFLFEQSISPLLRKDGQPLHPHICQKRADMEHHVNLSAVLGALVRRAIRGSLRVDLPFICCSAAGGMDSTIIARVRDCWRSARDRVWIRIGLRTGSRIDSRSRGISTLLTGGNGIVDDRICARNVRGLVHENLGHANLDARQGTHAKAKQNCRSLTRCASS
jgi:hypothetical protein